MQTDNTIKPDPINIRNGVLLLSGYGIEVRITNPRRLYVCDGIGRHRREGTFAKATSRLKRLLIMGQTGFITLPALHWLYDIGATFIHLNYDAMILMASVRGLDNPQLRRAQAFLTVSEERGALAKALLAPKIEAQAKVLESFGLACADALERPLVAMRNAKTLDLVLVAEALAATLYWNKWTNVIMQFARRDKVPDHWRIFHSRGSMLTPNARNATCPIGAIINYTYALLSVETRVALNARALDYGIGIFHKPGDAGLTADVMEPVRPHVDAFVLDLLRTRTFAARDFFEMRDGACRISAPLCRELAQTMPQWAKLVEPYAEIIARRVTAFAKHNNGAQTVQSAPHPRQGQHGRLKVRTQEISTTKIPKADPLIQAKHNSCRNCGVVLKTSTRKFCNQCLPERRQEHSDATFSTARPLGPVRLAELKTKGVDPRSSEIARERRVASSMAQRREIEAWQDDGSLKGVDFKRDVLPRIQGLSVTKLANSIHCSWSYASKIRRGEFVPHKRHWKRLIEFGQRGQK